MVNQHSHNVINPIFSCFVKCGVSFVVFDEGVSTIVKLNENNGQSCILKGMSNEKFCFDGKILEYGAYLLVVVTSYLV